MEAYIKDNQLHLQLDLSKITAFIDPTITGVSIDTLESYTGDSEFLTYKTNVTICPNCNCKTVYEYTYSPAHFKNDSATLYDFGYIVFVNVHIEGTPKPSTPCNYPAYKTIIAVDWDYIKRNGLAMLSDATSRCSNHSAFSDWVLRMQAFKLSVKSGDILHAKKYWEYLTSEHASITDKCNCNA